VESGRVVELLVELPRLRAGPRPTALELEADGLEVLSTRLVDAVGAETLWAARVRVDADAGSVPVVLRAVYADGRSVEVDETLVVVPGLDEPGGGAPWGLVAAGAAAAVALAGAVLLLARRRA
jgi:hypothetical protein